jgi:hypothetical protein
MAVAIELNAGQLLEGSTACITFLLKDHLNAPVPLASLSAAVLTNYDEDAYVEGASPAVGIINARNGQNVLNTNQVTIGATDGLVSWNLVPNDTRAPDDVASAAKVARRAIWRHRALFHFTYAGGELVQPVVMEIVNGRGA